MTTSASVEQIVGARYSEAAQVRENALCCPVSYDPKYLQIIPDEIKERDYGCGNPAEWVREGDTVLDLGSGGGKICYVAAQIVGPQGHVIGVDMNDEMLALAEKYRVKIAARLGFDNVEFRKGSIQDLRLDLRLVDEYLAGCPIRSVADLTRFEADCDELRRLRPLVADASVDVVLSNCVLNLVHPQDKEQLFAEMFRVVRPGGRVAISDIVSDADVPDELQRDPELWSGCISGAYREDLFVAAFERAGFQNVKIVKRDATPWRTLQDINFRAVTVLAGKSEAPLFSTETCCSSTACC